MIRTKIICTLGPASSEGKVIEQLLDAGMSAVRLNFSHGTHEEHANSIERVRAAAKERDRFVPLIADLQGPKIRVGTLKDGGPVQLKPGEQLRLTAAPITGDTKQVSIDYPRLAEDLQPGNRVLIDDGAIELQVTRIEGEDVVAEVVTGGLLRERKGVNVPEASLDLPSMTDKDEKDLQFALSQGVDYVALSFVRRAEDVSYLKRKIQKAQSPAEIIAKLEKPQALHHLEEILQESDGVMVARGDLGVELSPWRVPIEQKRIIEEAARARKPVITATQMLQSMIDKPSPTRAEASDVANAVFDGSDVLMLSGETAIGKYPVEAVRMMSRIIEVAEASLPEQTGSLPRLDNADDDLSGAVARSAAQLAEDLGVKYLVVYSESGYTARLVSKHRPKARILGLSRNEDVCRKMKLLWGVRARIVDPVDDVDSLAVCADSLLTRLGWVEKGDLICIVAGTPFRVRGKTDLIKLHRIGDEAKGKTGETQGQSC